MPLKINYPGLAVKFLDLEEADNLKEILEKKYEIAYYITNLNTNLFHILKLEYEEFLKLSKEKVGRLLLKLSVSAHPDKISSVSSSLKSTINNRSAFFNNLKAIFSNEYNYKIYREKLEKLTNFKIDRINGNSFTMFDSMKWSFIVKNYILEYVIIKMLNNLTKAIFLQVNFKIELHIVH